MVQLVKNLPASARDARDAGRIPGLGISSGGGNGNPLQYSCLEDSTDRGAWQDIVQRVVKRHDWAHIHHTYALIFYNFTIICLYGDFFIWIILELCWTLKSMCLSSDFENSWLLFFQGLLWLILPPPFGLQLHAYWHFENDSFVHSVPRAPIFPLCA